MSKKPHDVKDLKLADQGKKRIDWADQSMPVLRKIRERFAKEKPLKGVTLAACLHVTTETANLMRTLKAGGAKVFLCASNPLSTQDDIAAALVKHEGIPTFAIKGEDHKTYYAHLHAVLDESADDHHGRRRRPGLDAAPRLRRARAQGAGEHGGDHHRRHPPARHGARQASEDPGRRRQRRRDQAPVRQPLRHRPVDASTASSAPPAILFAGKTIVVAGYGWCGKGVAMRARGIGAQVIVTEVDPIRALEAAMDGFRVMPMRDACEDRRHLRHAHRRQARHRARSTSRR